MLGKWHLGHFRHAHLPRARGFGDFVGFYTGYIDPYTHVHGTTGNAHACTYMYRYLELRLHTRFFCARNQILKVSESEDCYKNKTGVDQCLLDLRQGFEGDSFDEAEYSTTYATQILQSNFASMVKAHDKSIPFFVYYSGNLVHKPVVVRASNLTHH
jgi:hypothetical protein